MIRTRQVVPWVSLIVACAAASEAGICQNASYTFFGKRCIGTTFHVKGLPKLGGAFFVTTGPTIIKSGFINWILTGLSTTRWNNISLPFDTRALSSPPLSQWCGQLLVSGELFMLSVGTNRFSIPNDKRLLGVVFYQQVLDQRPNRMRFGRYSALSQGGKAVVGN